MDRWSEKLTERLRLLHTIHDFLPRHRAGSEIYAFDLCRELATRHDVTVVAAEYDVTRRHGEVTWRVQDGLPVVEIVNNWACGSFADTYASPLITDRLRHVLHAIQPDVVHVHSLFNLSFDLPAEAHARGIPVVATLHDYTTVCPSGGQRVHRAEAHVCHTIDIDRCARCFRQSPQGLQASVAHSTGNAPAIHRLGRALLSRAPRVAGRIAAGVRAVAGTPVTPEDVRSRLAHAHRALDAMDLMVAPSPSIAEEFIQLGVEPSKVRVSDYGVRTFQPSPRQKHAGPVRLGCVGTLVWHKGVHVAVEAMRQLPAGSCELQIHGDPTVFPDYAADLRARARNLPVKFMGPFERDAVADVFASLDVLIVPSVWLENSPLVIHEAYLAGVPVVGSHIGGVADLVRDGWNGLLVEPGSSEALALAIRSLVDHPDRLDTFTARLPRVKSIEEDAREWEDVYRGVAMKARSEGAA